MKKLPVSDLDRQRIEWAIRFIKPPHLAAVDLAKLRADLDAFFDAPGGQVGGSFMVIATTLPMGKAEQVFFDHFPREFTMEDFSRLQTDLKTLFANLFDNDMKPQPFRITMVLSHSDSFGHTLHVNGSTHDCVLFLLTMALVNKPGGVVRRCPEAACGHKIFYREGKLEYCSYDCSNRARQRRWREAHRKKEAERQRKKYEKKVKRTMGGNVKVTRKKGGTR